VFRCWVSGCFGGVPCVHACVVDGDGKEACFVEGSSLAGYTTEEGSSVEMLDAVGVGGGGQAVANERTGTESVVPDSTACVTVLLFHAVTV
jgi:hypothetical protein